MSERRDNVGKRLKFNLDGYVLVRRLVDRLEEPAAEISVASPVGRTLRTLEAGDEAEVVTPEGRLPVQLLEVGEPALVEAAL
jgi:transcription elongation GreA/GreB family factor